MFAYCNNDPMVFVDSTGTFCVDWDINQSPTVGERFAEWYIISNEYEKDSNGNLTLNAKCKQTVRALANSIEFVIGLGMGLYGGVTIFDYANLDVGLYYDLLRITYIDGEYDLCQYGKEGISFTAFYVDVIPAMTTYYRAGLHSKNEWVELSEDEVINLFGASVYLYGGSTIEVNWDVVGLCEDLRTIWR